MPGLYHTPSEGTKVTELLQKAIEAVQAMPDDIQDAIASRLLEEVTDEQAWTALFDATSDAQWTALARATRRDIRAGRTTPIEDALGNSSEA